MTITRAGIGNFWYRGESALGTGTGSWYCVRSDEPPDVPTSTRKLAANTVAGHRNPFTVEKPVAYEIGKDGEIKFAQRIRRATSDGEEPSIMDFLRSAGWSVQTSTGATVEDGGSSTTTSIVQTADITNGTAGEAVIIIDTQVTPNLYRPILASSISSNTLTLSAALPNSPSSMATIEQMSTACPTSATTYQVPTDKTLQFRLNTWGEDDDALGDLSYIYSGCVLSTIDEFEIGPVGSIPTLSMSFHCCDVSKTANDIAADSFQDSAPFSVIDNNFEFMFATASSSGAIARVAKAVTSVKFNFGITVNRVMGNGGDSDVNGTQGYILIQQPPTCTVTAVWQDDGNFEDDWFTQLEGSNESKYIHAIQPTASLDSPAWGIWIPNAHLMPDSEPTIDWKSGDIVQATATFVGSTAGYNSETDIDEYGSSPIYFAVSGEAS